MAHKLALDIRETSAETTLLIDDASAYQTGAAEFTKSLYITVPGFETPVVIGNASLDGNFRKNITAPVLGLQPAGSDIPAVVPDGMYTIRFALSTGDEITYYHLRTTRLVNLLNRELCKVHFQDCEPSAEQKEHLTQLRKIRMYLEAAKAKVEYCHAPNQGLEMMGYAEKLLMKYIFKGCNSGDCVPCSNCSPCSNC
jgi:hypothetical protein